MKKKIVWFYPHLKFWMGGTIHLIEQLKRINAKEEFKVILIVNKGSESVIKKVNESKIKFVNFNSFCTNDFIYWLLFPIFLLKDLIKSYLIIKKINKQNKNSRLILFATLFPSNLIAFILSKIFNLDYYFYCYEPFPFFHDKDYIKKQNFSKKIILRTLSFLYSWLDILAVRSAILIFTSNNIKRKMIKKVYRRDSIVTLLGVDINLFKKIDSSDNLVIKKYGKLPIIFHSTDYTPTKNTDLAIRIFKEVNSMIPKSILLISSTQPNNSNKKTYQDLVKRLDIEEKVKFLGLVPLGQLPHYYSASICYLFTATLDIHSTSLPNLEAMACETPVIRPRINHKQDLEFKDKEAGYLVNIENVKEVAKKIVYLIKNPSIRLRMGKNGRKIIEDKYRWENVADIIIKNIRQS